MGEDIRIISGPKGPELVAWFDDFDGDHPYTALSNFYVGEPFYMPVVDEWYTTGEHAYQAAKAVSPTQERQIMRAVDPGEAKALGNQCRLRPNWEAVKYDVMMAVLRAKFTLDREEGDILLETGDALLIEGTYWGDTVWGVSLGSDANPVYAPGRNWLGTMLMARRAELRAEVKYRKTHRTDLYNTQFVVRGTVVT
jgi:ribA/ribD-fused uncharacterized protein